MVALAFAVAATARADDEEAVVAILEGKTYAMAFVSLLRFCCPRSYALAGCPS